MENNANEENVFIKIWNKIKARFSKKKLIEAKGKSYDDGVNTVVMKAANFENLKVNMEKLNKKIRLDNGFISVDDLSDEEIEEMILLYNDELKELNRKIIGKKLELERLERENNK